MSDLPSSLASAPALALPFGAAIFDMDGLLLDSERPILAAWLQAARELEVTLAPETFLHVLGRRAVDVGPLFRAAFPPDFPFAQARARVQELIAILHQREGFQLKPGVAALLARLAEAGVPAAVASSTRRSEVERRLARAALTPYFQAVVGGDEVREGKPAPDIFLLAAERLGISPARCVVFEDMEHGARGAIAAGMQAVLVPDLKQPSDDARALCLSVLASLEHLDPLFGAWFAAAAPT